MFRQGALGGVEAFEADVSTTVPPLAHIVTREVSDAYTQLSASLRFENALLTAHLNKVMALISEHDPILSINIDGIASSEFDASMKHVRDSIDSNEKLLKKSLDTLRSISGYL